MTRTLPFLAASLLYAAPAVAQETQRIPFGDLDLSSPPGATAFDRRVRDAGRQACREANGPTLVDLGCLRRFRRDALQALPGSRRHDYARSRSAAILAVRAGRSPA
ncbi:UrcA family protein [Brevundimonas sp.]|uniref:UrcA family protein n=1 Tax=Brevundimonas sp. TaxID=1871086 RepID=UPI002D6519C7|nr:UrcA family protein [Brevundimonas sp.]HYC73651.1 UrcA family protein [Brevundimonas sp.]